MIEIYTKQPYAYAPFAERHQVLPVGEQKGVDWRTLAARLFANRPATDCRGTRETSDQDPLLYRPQHSSSMPKGLSVVQYGGYFI